MVFLEKISIWAYVIGVVAVFGLTFVLPGVFF